MQARLSFALAVNSDPDILLVDEILTVGDEAFQVGNVWRGWKSFSAGKTIVFVSHSPEDVKRFVIGLVLTLARVVFFERPPRPSTATMRREGATGSLIGLSQNPA